MGCLFRHMCSLCLLQRPCHTLGRHLPQNDVMSDLIKVNQACVCPAGDKRATGTPQRAHPSAHEMGGPPNGGASLGAFDRGAMDHLHRWHPHLGVCPLRAFPLEGQNIRILHKLIGRLGNSLCWQTFNLFAWNITFHLFIDLAQKNLLKAKVLESCTNCYQPVGSRLCCCNCSTCLYGLLRFTFSSTLHRNLMVKTENV